MNARTSPIRLGAGRARLGRRAAVLAVLVLTCLSPLVGAGVAAPAALGAAATPFGHVPVPVAHPALRAHAAPPTAAQALAAVAPPAPPASGRGTFFSTATIAQAPSTSCGTVFGYACVNDSYDPAINLSATPPHGATGPVLGVAFTQVTDASPCANVASSAQTEIGFSYSDDLGTTWSTPSYLGLTDCALAADLPSAYQPTLASLANGTFVLAYIAYNISQGYTAWFQQSIGGAGGYYSITGAALVFTESYDGGVSWTSPSILNESLNPNVLVTCCDANDTNAYTPQRPWITAIGQTIYLAWTNDTFQAGFDYYCQVAPYEYSACYGEGSSQVHLLVSTDGGQSWLARADLATIRPALNQTISAAENPYVLVTPSGTVFVAYLTEFYLPPWSVRQSTGNYLANGTLELAATSDNGSSFTYTTIATDLQLGDGPTNPPFQGGLWGTVVAPQLAYSARYGQLYATWSMFDWGPNTQCPLTCPHNSLYQNIYVTNSSDGGATWTPYHLVSPALNDTSGSAAYNPAIAVLPDGTVAIASAFDDLNQSVNWCFYATVFGIDSCPLREVYLASHDNATTFGPPVLLSDDLSGNAGSDPSGWYDTATVVNGTFIVAWAQKFSTASPGNYSFWPSTCCGYALARSQIAVSTLYDGTGLTLTYADAGLPVGYAWTVDVMGNLFQATAPNAITVSGIPSGANISWLIPQVAGPGYGFRYTANQSVVPPAVIPRSLTVYENFSEQVLVQIRTNPFAIECPTLGNQAYFVVCWNPPQSYYYHFDHDVLPYVGSAWLAYGVPLTLNASPADMCFSTTACSIYTSFLNLSFSAWTGTGLGSVNTSRDIVTITPTGPINETANFQILGICTNPSRGSYAPSCTLNETMQFHETGLPAGTQWNVTIDNDQGLTATSGSTTAWVSFSDAATRGLVNYTVWTVPSSTPGKVWVGSTSPASPVEIPAGRLVNVSFVLTTVTSSVFSVAVNETGLNDPRGTGWSIDFGSTALGLRAAQTVLAVAGGSYSVDVPSVFLDNGSAYYAASLTVEKYSVNESVPTVYATLPSNVSLSGPSLLRVTFALEYLVTVSASPGGSVSPGSTWVPLGAALTLLATPASNYHFVGWSGTGPGGMGGTTASLVVTPVGPVSEAATFQWNGAATWSVVVRSVGLPAGTGFTVGFGNQTVSGSGSVTFTGLAAGDYAITIPYAYSNASALTRYVGEVSSTSLSSAGAGLLTVQSNGTINVSYSEQFTVSLSATSGGSIGSAAGSTWEDSGATVAATAMPDAGSYFAGWVGSGAGSVSGTSATIELTVAGPVTEVAQFLPQASALPATFSVSVEESGLPSGISWSVVVGGSSITGSGSSLTVALPNGSYAVSVPNVTAGYGLRYAPTSAATTATVSGASAMLTVTFAEQFWVAVSAGSGGATSTASGWVASGTAVELSATPAAGQQFAGWVGSGSGSYSGASATQSITPTGPVNETATFQPVAATSSSSSASDLGLAVGVAIAVALVGATAVYLLLRRGRSRPPAPGAAAEAPTRAAEEPNDGENPPDPAETASD